MKYLICSDIHGSSESVEYLIQKFKNEKCDLILCLGDVLYHGPRNDLPQNYNPKEVIRLLNEYKDFILCVRGNCEAEVDQMVLDFQILDSFDGIINGIKVHLEHGHHLDEYAGDAKIILYGHTHIPVCEVKNNQCYINPGSITIPKASSKRGYAIWDEHCITGYTMDNEKTYEYKY